jgi:hypothetical protein
MKNFEKIYTFEFIEWIFNTYFIAYLTENPLHLHSINDVYESNRWLLWEL